MHSFNHRKEKKSSTTQVDGMECIRGSTSSRPPVSSVNCMLSLLMPSQRYPTQGLGSGRPWSLKEASTLSAGSQLVPWAGVCKLCSLPFSIVFMQNQLYLLRYCSSVESTRKFFVVHDQRCCCSSE